MAVVAVTGTTREELTMQRSKMRKRLLLGTVALMATVGLASAQGMREGQGAAGGGAEPGMSSGAKTSQPAAKQGGAELQNKGNKETRGEGAQPKQDRVSGQAKPAERSTTGQGSSDKDAMKPQSSQKPDKDQMKAKSSQKGSQKDEPKAKNQSS